MRTMKTLRALMIAAVIIVLLFPACSKNELGKAGDTVEKLATDFYSMTVKSDAGFDRFVEQGGASSTQDVSAYLMDYLSVGPWGNLGGFACSALVAGHTTGGYLMGRNYDWDNCKTLVIKCFPQNGYASVSTANLEFLGFGEDYEPIGMIDGFKATAAVYVPMDGINEKGLVVADLMAGDNEVTNQNTSGKLNLTTTTTIRYLLNHAANVEEAIEMLQSINMHSDEDFAHHLMIADANGRSVVTEWVNGNLIVTESPVLNNHYLCEEKQGVGLSQRSWEHEATLLAALQENPVMDAEGMADAMFSAVALPDDQFQGGTQWTIVYDMTEKSATYYWRRDRAKKYTFYANKEDVVRE